MGAGVHSARVAPGIRAPRLSLDAGHAVADYIEVFYNLRRLHSTLPYKTPLEALTEHPTAAAAA
jgi:hypothetical protein